MGAEAFAGFVEELAEDGPGLVGVAALRRKDVRVAEGFSGGDEIGDFIAAQKVPEAVA